MKLKNIKITIKDHGTVQKEFAEALGSAKKGEAVMPHYEVSFEDIDTLRKVLTEKRLELLHVIKQQQPESMYELAQLVSRDLKSVQDDLHLLEDLGLLSLEHRLIPHLDCVNGCWAVRQKAVWDGLAEKAGDRTPR